MNFIINTIKGLQPILQNKIYLMIVFAIALVIPIAVSVVLTPLVRKTKIRQLNIFLFREIVALIFVYGVFVVLSKFLFKFTLVQSTITAGVFFTSTLLIQFVVSIVIYIIYVILSATIRGIKFKKITKLSKEEQQEELSSSSIITQCATRFTSNYIKSFITPGIPADRLVILQENREDYLRKLTEYLADNAPINKNRDISAIAEFYYSYFIKRWFN